MIYPCTGESLIRASKGIGNIDIVRWLIKARIDVDTIDNSHKKINGYYFSWFLYWTPLMHASLCGHIKIVALLLKAGANVNYSNEAGANALLNASIQGNAKIVALLLKYAHPIDCKKLVEEASIYLLAENRPVIEKMIIDVIILVPFMSKKFKSINKSIIREAFKN
jgi:hypothetical protein